MSDKIAVPEGMWDAARRMYALANSLNGRTDCSDTDRLMYSLEAALRWLAENPIVPTAEQVDYMRSSCDLNLLYRVYGSICTEWQRRMFLAPDEDEPIKDLMEDCPVEMNEDSFNNRLREAYRRGKEGK